MDELELIAKRHKMRTSKGICKNEKKRGKANLFSKVLLSIIFILISCIYIHLDENNLANYKKNIFESNITFAKINNWYHNTFGSIMPTISTTESQMAFNENNNDVKEEYLDGYKIEATYNPIVTSLASGILVYLDEKEGYGKTAIIQGVDGIDIWYGNLVDTTNKLYDYIEEGQILGNAKDNYYYNVFMKEGSKLTYDEYKTLVQT